MTETIAWVGIVELVSAAFIPLTVWLFRTLPDRGYIFAKILGLLVVTYCAWIIGSVIPVAGSPILPYSVLFISAVAAWWLGYEEVACAWRGVMRVALIEEAIFLTGIGVYALLRAHVFGAAIAHTEQYMDLALLTSSVKSASYPPFDPWMSGHTVNYYYFGYLMFGTLTKLSGVAAASAYNLSLAFVCGFTLAGTYSIGLSLTRHVRWAALAPIFVGLIGNWHALLWQLPHNVCSNATGTGGSDFWNWLWPSTRVIANNYTLAAWGCAAATHDATNTINEYPLFSFVLGDLHPHVMSIPVVLLVLAMGASIVFAGDPLRVAGGAHDVGRLAVLAVAVGALFTINSWDFPTYLLLAAGCLTASAYINDPSRTWWRAPLITVPALSLASLVLFTPFYLHFRSLASGFGFVGTPSDPFEFIQVFGFPLLLAVLLVGSLTVFLSPAEEADDEREASAFSLDAGSIHEAGHSRVPLALGASAGAVIVAIAISRGWVPGSVGILLIAFGIWTGRVLWQVVNTEEPNRSDTLALIVLLTGCFVLVLTEVVYVKDIFQGGPSYRMNTVFKFYYQAWLLLGLGGAYAVYRMWHVVAGYVSRPIAIAAVIVVTLGGIGAGTYTMLLPTSSVAASSDPQVLDGSAWIAAGHPDDYAAIVWLRTHASGSPVVLEATKDEYMYDSRISTFTGLPTVMGWAGHEDQWRLNDPEIQIRVSAVHDMYTDRSATATNRLLRTYRVRYVVIGDQERSTYGPLVGSSIRKLLHLVFRHGGTSVYAR